MGNNGTTPVPSPVCESASGCNHSMPAHFGSYWFFSDLMQMMEMFSRCHIHTNSSPWLGLKIAILATALPANAGLTWMLLSGKRALSPSELLGINIAILDVLYCLCLPLDIYASLHEVSETSHAVNESLFALNAFGCPVLLELMCLERYVAAAHPVTYIRLGKREHRVVLCALTWILTLAVALLTYFIGVFHMALYLAVTISVLFLSMLLCLAGIVWVLCRSRPGEGSGTSVTLRRKALRNILAVIIPAVLTYSPLVALVPVMAVILSQNAESVSPAQCKIPQTLLEFPNFGLYIGPMFYVSRVRQLACWRRWDKGSEQSPDTKTQVD